MIDLERYFDEIRPFASSQIGEEDRQHCAADASVVYGFQISTVQVVGIPVTARFSRAASEGRRSHFPSLSRKHGKCLLSHASVKRLKADASHRSQNHDFHAQFQLLLRSSWDLLKKERKHN